MYSKFFSDFFRVKLARKKEFENENLGDKIPMVYSISAIKKS
jgi:hypothetical protein